MLRRKRTTGADAELLALALDAGVPFLRGYVAGAEAYERVRAWYPANWQKIPGESWAHNEFGAGGACIPKTQGEETQA